MATKINHMLPVPPPSLPGAYMVLRPQRAAPQQIYGRLLVVRIMATMHESFRLPSWKVAPKGSKGEG